MNDSNLCMLRPFKIPVKEYQNPSIETWITAAKFSLKIPIRSEDMDKMQTEFPQSGLHNSSGRLLLIL